MPEFSEGTGMLDAGRAGSALPGGTGTGWLALLVAPAGVPAPMGAAAGPGVLG